MEYSIKIKQERMSVVNEHISGGKIEIYTSNYEKLLVKIELSNPAGVTLNNRLSLIGLPLSGIALADGEAEIAKITKGDVVETLAINNLIVGKSNAHLILDNTNIAVGQTVIIREGEIIHG